MTEGPALRPLLVCADDFGLAPAIDEAVAALVAMGRLGAFSCLVNAPGWPVAAGRVAALRPQAMAGLHLNLTEGRPLSAALARHWPVLPPVTRLLRLAHTAGLPQAAVHAELSAQWQAFADTTGGEPDFLDGHQHVHHLPGVRQWVLAQALPRRLPVRNTAWLPGPGSAFKRWVIERSGGRALGRALQARGLPHAPCLLGAYGFADPDYRARMQAWLAQVPQAGAWLFCHPAQGGAGLGHDQIAAARLRERAYLAGPHFPQDLARAGVTLVSAWPAAGAAPAVNQRPNGG